MFQSGCSLTRLHDDHEDRKGKWYYIWRFLVATVVWFFNTDWVVIPSLKNRALSVWGVNLYDFSWFIPELSLFQIFVIISVISTLELVFAYYFLVWLRDEAVKIVKKRESVQEAVDIIHDAVELREEIETAVKPVINKASLRVLRDRIIDFTAQWFHWSTSDLNPMMVRLRRLGYWGLLVFSIIPETGTRLFAILICGLSKSKKGMLMVTFGNSVKNLFMVFAFWGPVSKMSPHTQFLFLLFVFILLLILTVAKSIKSKKT